MSDLKFTMFRNRLHKVAKHLSKHARREGLTCYRVYDHDLPEFPICIEFYDDKLYVAEYRRRHGMTDEEHDDWMEKTLEVIMEELQVKRENIFLKLRQRKPGRLGQYQKTGASLHEFVVTENGLKFLVNLSDYLDTGLFLDHRITRQMVREQSAGKKVLNLFAYTASFSVYAAAGKAREVVTVDLSKTYLDWAQRNFDLNNPLFDTGQDFRFVHADVKKWLALLKEKDFDIIIMDPPTFSNSKRMDGMLDIQRDHVALINNCLEVLVQGGQLYFSTNFRKFQLEKEKLKAASIRDITRQTTPFDFEGRLFRSCYLLIK